jgi:hypothetical protein
MNMLIFHIEADDMNKAFQVWGTSKDPFDVWTRDFLKEYTDWTSASIPLGPSGITRILWVNLHFGLNCIREDLRP